MIGLHVTGGRSQYTSARPTTGVNWCIGTDNARRIDTLLTLSVIALLAIDPVNATEKLVINCGNAGPYFTPEGGGFYADIAAEAFRRIDIEAGVIYVPAARSLINGNQGIEDGNIARIADMEKKFPNLIPVPEKNVDFEFTVFTRDVDF
jgi:polar amino acid transport system substrate-binding protein